MPSKPFVMSLQHYVVFGVIALSLVIGGAQYVSYLQQSKAIVEAVEREDLEIIASTSFQGLSAHIDLHERLTMMIGDNIVQNDALRGQSLQQYFFSIMQQFPQIKAIFLGTPDNALLGFNTYTDTLEFMQVEAGDPDQVIRFYPVDETGNLLAETQSKAGFSTTTRPWYTAALYSSGLIWSDIFYYHINDAPALPLSISLYDASGKLLGVLGMNLFLDTVGSVLEPPVSHPNTHLGLLDSEGKFLAGDAELPGLLQSLTNEYDTFNTADAYQPVIGNFLIEDHHYYVYQTGFSELAGESFSVISVVNLEPKLANARAIQNQYVLAIAGIVLVTILLYYLFMRRLLSGLDPSMRLLKKDPLKEKPDEDTNQNTKKHLYSVREFYNIEQALRSAYQNTHDAYHDMQVAQTQLRLSEQEARRLAKVSELTADPIVLVDRDCQILWSNHSFQRSFGIKASDAGKISLNQLMTNVNANLEAVDRMKLAIANAESQRIDLHITSPVQESFYFTVEVNAVESTASDSDHCFCVFSDITTVRRQQDALMLWKEVFDQANLGLAISRDNSLLLEHVNPFLAEMLGYRPNDLQGREIGTFMSEELRASLPGMFDKINQEGSLSYQGNLLKKNGEEFPALVSVTLVRNEQDEPLYRIASVQDLTTFVDLQAKIQQQSKLQVLGQLTSGIVHDFNNILGAINFNNSLIELELDKLTNLPPDKYAQLAKIIAKNEHSVNAAANLIDQILVFAKQQKQHARVLDIAQLIEETINVMHRRTASITKLDTKFPPYPVNVEGVKSQLMQLFMNLLSNAEKAIQRANREKGFIKVQVTVKRDDSSPGDYAVITVDDNGAGIPFKQQDKVFDVFQSFDSGRQSTGIGLALVKKVTELHAGTVTFESTPEVGTRFMVKLPLSQQAATQTTTGIKKDGPRNQQLRFIIVDDEEILLESFKSLLEHAGHKVKGFTDSRFALEYIKTHPQGFDVLITDYVMPNINGKVLTEEVRQVNTDAIVFVMTGYADASDEQEFKQAGANQIFMKPVKAKDLLRAVEKYQSLPRAAAPATEK